MIRVFFRFIVATVLGCACVVSAASGADAQIVALGASNTRGKGVASDETYSARLEALLRSRGLAVTVTNEGVDFDTLSGMLHRLDRSVPQGNPRSHSLGGWSGFPPGQTGGLEKRSLDLAQPP